MDHQRFIVRNSGNYILFAILFSVTSFSLRAQLTISRKINSGFKQLDFIPLKKENKY